MRRVLIPARIAPGAPPADAAIATARGESMGTTWSVQAVGADAQLHALVQAELDAVVAQMSHWLPDSDLSRFNAAPAGSWHSLPDAFWRVLCAGADVAAATGGAFSPWAGAQVDAWGFGPRGRHDEPGFAPPPAPVARAQEVQLDRVQRRAYQPGGARLDLSAIAKGFAVDQVARRLEAHGIAHYLVEVGGELRGAGLKPGGLPWWVALEQAPGDTGEPAMVALHGLSIATSGDYRKHYEHAGTRISHTIDPRSGAPVRHGVASVTVFHPECMLADALSTALMVLGPREGMAFAEREGIPARMLVRDGGRCVEHASSRFLEMLQ